MLRQGEGEVVRLLLRHRPFIRTGLDLVEQDIPRPAELGGGAEVVKAGGGVGEFGQNVCVMAPWNCGDQFSHNCESSSGVKGTVLFITQNH